MKEAGLVLMVHTGTRQALHHALSLALVALADQQTCVVALFYDGLAAWQMESEHTPSGFGTHEWAARLQSGFERLGIHGPHELLGECRSLGGERFRVVACGGSVETLGLCVDDLLAHPLWYDDIVGLPTLWRWGRNKRILTI